MDPELRNTILRAQRETRQAEGRQTAEDKATQRQFDDLKAMNQFAGWNIFMPTTGAIKPETEWTGTAAVARFTLDGRPFTIRKDRSEFLLLAGDAHGQVLARVAADKDYQGATKFLSAIGDYLSVSGTELPG